MRRFGLFGVLTLVLLGVAAAPGWACNPPKVEVTAANPTYPGDWVDYGVIGLTGEAEYTLKVGYQEVVHAKATPDGTATGRFQMPDVGTSSRPISVEVVVQHDDIASEDGTLPGSSTRPLNYGGDTRPVTDSPQGASTPAADAPPAPSPAESAPQQAESAPSAAPPAPPTGSSGPSEVAPRPSGHGPAPASPQRRSERGSRHRSPSAVRRAVVQPDAIAMAPARPVAATRVAVPRVTRTDNEHVRRAAPVVISRPEVAATGAVRTVAHTAQVLPERTAAAHEVLLLAIALAVLVAALILRRRGWGRAQAGLEPDSMGPRDQAACDLREQAIEAELQEMIAEAKARADRSLSGVP